MDLDPQYTSNKSHSGIWNDDEECRGQNATKYHVKHTRKHKELDEESLIRYSGQEDRSHFDFGVGNNEICEANGHVILTKSCCDDSTRKTTCRRTTLRELLQLPEDCESPAELISERKIFKHPGHQGQKLLEMKYKWCGLLKSQRLFWSSLLKLQCREKKKILKWKYENDDVFVKVSKSAERIKLLKPSEHT